jgi:hypothetical protein
LAAGVNTYAYARGSPISWTDKLGLKPGDLWNTPQQAAFDALDWAYAELGNANEWLGTIYQVGDQYVATTPNPGSHEDGLPSWPTEDQGGRSAAVALYHTHGHCEKGYDNDNFSYPDKKNGLRSDAFVSDWYQLPSYLETPGGMIKRYDPDPNMHQKGHVITMRDGCACQK